MNLSDLKDRTMNLVELARLAEHRDDRVALLGTARDLVAEELKALPKPAPKVRQWWDKGEGRWLRKGWSKARPFERFYTSDWYYHWAVDVEGAGVADRVEVGARDKAGVWLTPTEAARASRFTTDSKARGLTAPRKRLAGVLS